MMTVREIGFAVSKSLLLPSPTLPADVDVSYVQSSAVEGSGKVRLCAQVDAQPGPGGSCSIQKRSFITYHTLQGDAIGEVETWLSP